MTGLTTAHLDQVDKAGRPYIGHPQRVAARVAADHSESHPAVAVAVAWLHDVVEDTPVTFEAVAKRFGQEVATAVDAITRRAGGEPDVHYGRVAANEIARVVKLADIADNTDPDRLSELPAETADRLRTKYAHAREQLSVPSES